MPAHRSPVDDDPARLADLLHEELAQGDEILDEQVRLILTRPVPGRDPRVARGEDVVADRRRADRSRTAAPLDAVSEDLDTPLPFRGHLDQITRAAEHAAPADRRALRLD